MHLRKIDRSARAGEAQINRDQMEGEIARLESNHVELLSHQTTLQKQLRGKEKHVKQLQNAVTQCQNALRKANVPFDDTTRPESMNLS